jgi:hypothetical protein
MTVEDQERLALDPGLARAHFAVWERAQMVTKNGRTSRENLARGFERNAADEQYVALCFRHRIVTSVGSIERADSESRLPDPNLQTGCGR